MNTERQIHVTIRLPIADADRLSAEAKRLHLSASATICRALAEMCERQGAENEHSAATTSNSEPSGAQQIP